jgi:hypothetical protein
VKLKQYHQDDAELAFYKFYYEMLEKWLHPNETYLILLDHKSNKGDGRCVTLWRCLESHFTGNVDIVALTTIDSARTPLAQLCDVFTGCLAAANNGIKAGTAKAELADYIRDKAGLAALSCGTPLNAEKFNIFKPALR